MVQEVQAVKKFLLSTHKHKTEKGLSRGTKLSCFRLLTFRIIILKVILSLRMVVVILQYFFISRFSIRNFENYKITLTHTKPNAISEKSH